MGHLTKYCKFGQTGCYKGGALDHFRSAYLKAARAPAANQGRGRAFAMNVNKACHNNNVVTGTFPINECFCLFDTGSDKSFVSIEFAKFIGLELSVAPELYSVELANGKLLEANSVTLGCTLNWVFSI
jgi:hypothetical protein